MASIFTKIINGEIPCQKILEDEQYFSFLDINPINPGHTLVIPKQETDYLFALDDNILSGLFLFAKKIVPAIEQVISCKRVGVIVAGLEVPHAHVHLIPMGAEGELTFDRAQRANPQDLAALAQKIIQHLK
ncbi:MAG: HIT family protein [Fibrobacteria bacterium]|nr:HIT family protein [Fibrobacteria bacterium]